MKESNEKRITYQKLFWLFIAGSLLGVVIEGLFCLYSYGKWETHVVSVWGPFCIIYGFGAAILYAFAVLLEKKNVVVRFLTYALVASVVEYIGGALLKYGLSMRAWSYDNKFLNIDGIICLNAALSWGIMGLLFERFAVPPLEKLFAKMQGRGWKTACNALTVFMVVNLSLTSMCLVRWSQRYKAVSPNNSFEEYLDEKYNDDYMQNRFVEWKFIE